MNNLKLISLAALCAFIFCACNNKGEYSSKYPTNKLAPNDPFAATMVGSQTFEIDPNTENFVEGEKGTVVLVPAGAFLDKNGNIPKGKITVELAEALTVEDMLLSNLTTTSDGKPLQSGGMLYLNATTESGEQLHVDATKPLYIEVPTENKVAGMQAYVGIRDSMGNMNWVDPKPIVNYLVKVDLKDLDFLPAGFYDTVKTNMPYKGHLEADKPLADSLYYSLAVNDGSYLTDGLKNTDMNEPQYNRNKKIENGKYDDQSFDIEPMNSTPNDDYKVITVQQTALDSGAACGINPASIKVLKSKKFANSFIATREFEERMHHIHQTCQQEVIDIYITNIGKNLWEADQAAYDYLKSINNAKAEVFKNFYQQKLTTVEGASKYADKLAKYYKQQLKKIEAQLQNLKEKEIKNLQKENDKVEKVKEKYRKTLWKREKYRNTRYGWEWTDLGWINVDKPGPVLKCSATKVEIKLKDDTDYDRIYSYVLIPSLKSMYRLNTTDNEIFYGGSAADHLLHLPCFEPVNIILIAYKGEQSYFAMAKESPVDQKIVLDSPAKLEAYSADALKATLKKYNGSYAKENSIEKDLKFQFKFYKEQQRQQTLKSEQEFIQKLQRVRCSVCRSLKSETQALFENNCTSCHAVCDKILGPPLYKVQEREGRTMEWLISFTKNSAKMIADGDPLAVRLYRENNGAVMSSFENLSDKEIKSIYAYIRQFDCSTDIGGN
jgi:hypothetical protein